jgi:DNA-binding beta-propeller fold protein YncE
MRLLFFGCGWSRHRHHAAFREEYLMAVMPPEPSGEARAALREIVARHGPEALSRPEQLSNLLQDLLPNAPGVARLLVAAAEDHIADALLGHVSLGLDAATAARRSASSFAASTMYAPEVCAWAAGEFAIALGLMSDADGPPTVVPPLGPGTQAVLPEPTPGREFAGGASISSDAVGLAADVATASAVGPVADGADRPTGATRAPIADPGWFMSGSGHSGIPPVQRHRRRNAAWALLAGACILAVATALALDLTGHGRGSGHAAKISLTQDRCGRSRLPGPASPDLAATLAVKAYIPESVAFRPGGKILAVATATNGSAGCTYLWNLATHAITPLYDPGGQGAESVAFRPDGAALAVGDADGQACLWNLTTDTVTARLPDPRSQGVQAVAFSPDGTTLAVGDGNGRTYLWNLATRSFTVLRDPDSSGVQAVAFSPDGTTLAAGDGNGSTYLWNLATRTTTATLGDPGFQGVQAVAFSPSGTVLATGDHNGRTYLWNLLTRTRTATIYVPEETFGVSSVAFGPDGTTLAISDHNGSTYLWHLPAPGP